MGRWCSVIIFCCSLSVCSALLGENNHGSPRHPVKTQKSASIETLVKSCTWRTKSFSEAFVRSDMKFYENSDAWLKSKASQVGFDFFGSTCEMPDNSGGTWVLQRFGPMRSTGGYDWWQFAWSNLFDMNAILRQHPRGVYFTNTFSGVVDETGKTVPYPPIHIHHVHFTPGEFPPQTVSPRSCLESNLACGRRGQLVAEHHGDYQCLDAEGGVDCLLEDLPASYGKLVKTPLLILGELNDVRPAGSPEMRWWYLAAVRYVPKEAAHMRALSIHAICNAFSLSPAFTLPAPTDEATWTWFVGQMPKSGALVRAKIHSHMTIFKEMFLFAATPDQLGLSSSRFKPKNAFDLLRAKDVGFHDMSDVRKYIMDNYERNRSHEAQGIERPRLICHAEAMTEKIAFPSGQYHFDRRAPTWCDIWDFKSGDTFTLVGFNEYVGGPPGPHMPDSIPHVIPQHFSIWVQYESSDEASYYTSVVYTQDLGHEFLEESAGWSVSDQLFATTVAMNGGMPTRQQYVKLANKVAPRVFKY
jgi:hypothetical protein